VNQIIKTNYYEIIRNNSVRYPKKKAVICEDNCAAGFNDFLSIYNPVTEFLNSKSVNKFDRITIITSDIISYCLLLIPVLDNATWVPMDPDSILEKAKEQLDLYGTSYIITDDLEKPVCQAAADMGIGVINFKVEGGFCTRKCFLKISAIKSIDIPDYKKKPDCIVIGSTSGTTSTPKIVPITYESHNLAINRKIKRLEYSNKDVMLIFTKVHRTQSINSMLLMLKTGGITIFSNGFNHNTFFKFIDEYNITTFTATPAVLSSLVDYIEKNNITAKNNCLRFIRSSGAPLADELKSLIETTLNTEIIISYGMTETRNISSTYGTLHGYKKNSVGKSSGVMVKIEKDEILVKGETVFNGYENPEIDNSTFFTDGWFHTGDNGYIDEDGYIFITGRIKEMINRGGEKISPYEVEKAIKTHPYVKEAAVFPYPGRDGVENAGAVIILRDGVLELSDLRKFLKGRISPYKMPSLLFCADEIPVNENGKINRKTLYKALENMKVKPDSKENSNNAEHRKMSKEQKIICRILGNALKKKALRLRDNFLDSGGDSLSGAVVLSVLERRFGIRVPVNILFESGSAEVLDDYIKNQKRNKHQSRLLVPVKSSGNKKPLICVHSGTGDAVTYRHIAKYMPEDRPVMALRFNMKATGLEHPLTFPNLARAYCEEIKKIYPEGPYYICGHCWGGVLAHLIASLLKDDGCEIGMLAMFDSAIKKTSLEKTANSNDSVKRIIRVFKGSLKYIGEVGFKQKIKLIIKKALSFFKLIALLQAHKIYALGKRRGSILLMKLSGRPGALGYASSKYFPKSYSGRIHYFRAVRGGKQKSHKIDFWESMADHFTLVDINSYHNAMITGEDARILSSILADIMENADA